MQDFINLIGQAIVALLMYGALAATYGLLGAYKNISIFKHEFDWKTYADGVTKYLALGFGVVAVIAGSYGLITLAPSWGVQLDNAQQISTKVIFGILAAGIAGMLLKNVQKLVQIFSVDPSLIDKLQQQAIDNPNPNAPVILDVGDLPGGKKAHDDEVAGKLSGDPGDNEAAIKAVVEKYLQEVGGKGAVVPTDSPDSFRNVVINHSYDVDGYYGAQCWDGAALFWLNGVGRTFSTGGTGAARGGWEAARAVNAGNDFDLITNPNDILPGDWCVFGGTQWGHVGMARSGNLGGYIRLLGQNQTGDGNGAPFSEINMSLNNFLGAFRLKRWHVAAPAPTPTPAPAPAPSPAPNPAIEIGSTVQPIRAVDFEGVQMDPKVLARLYPVTSITGDRAVLGNGLNTAFHTGDLRLVSNPEASLPAPAPAAGFNVGDKVNPTNVRSKNGDVWEYIDYDGIAVAEYRRKYYHISELKGDRAVLTAEESGIVWCAMNTANLQHVG